MPATTILASFDEPVPTRTNSIVEDPRAHISGPSTSAAEPPKFGLRLQNFFAQVSIAPLDLNQSRLRDSYLATWEETRNLQLEADVSDAAAVQLINPVDLALSAHHPRQVYQLNQETVAALVRADKNWHRLLDGGTLRFAVLDYKRPGVIRPKEFTQALFRPEQLARQLSRAGKITTLFSLNSQILLKQAVNYSYQYQTKYIAFFDWEYLLLIYLNDAEESNGGTYCCIELLKDRSHFRRALLGFLEAAYQSRGGYASGGPTYPTVNALA